MSVTEDNDEVNGRNGYRPREVDLRFGKNLLTQIYGYLFGWCGAAFWVQDANDIIQCRMEGRA